MSGFTWDYGSSKYRYVVMPQGKIVGEVTSFPGYAYARARRDNS